MGQQFEDPASVVITPMILGQAVSLTPRQQMIVATWSAKTMLLHSYEKHFGIFPEIAELLRNCVLKIRMTNAPLPVMRIRLGFTDAEVTGDDDMDGREARRANRLRAAVRSSVGGAFSIFEFGHLVVEMTAATPHDIVAMERTTQDQDYFLTVYPITVTDVFWPPRRTLPLGALQILNQLVAAEYANSLRTAPLEIVERLAEPLPPRRKTRKRSIRLRVVPEEATHGGSILNVQTKGPLFLGNDVPLAMNCGNCDFTFTRGVAVGQMRGRIYLKCPTCSSFNAVPDPGEFPEADAVSGEDATW